MSILIILLPSTAEHIFFRAGIASEEEKRSGAKPRGQGLGQRNTS